MQRGKENHADWVVCMFVESGMDVGLCWRSELELLWTVGGLEQALNLGSNRPNAWALGLKKIENGQIKIK